MKCLLLFLGAMVCWVQPHAQDTLTLPFAIAHEKRLPEDELKDKREGTFITGVPDLSSDPVNGFGYGAEGSITFNGKRTNPFFEYTPYQSKLDIVLFNTTRNQREIAMVYDHPYVLQSKWRLRAEAAYEINPNLLYFGTTSKTLQSLSSISSFDAVGSETLSNQYDQYNAALGDNAYYNQYTKEEYILNVSGEYSLLESRMRLLGGFEYARLNITPSGDGRSRLVEDAAGGKILGLGKSQVSFLQMGLIYDTRDFESDPSNGVFIELTDEWSQKGILSDYNINKLFLQVKGFKRLLPSAFKKLIFAYRGGMGYTFGAAPFFEYQDEWSSEGSIECLGGGNTIRGYKQNRFLDRGIYFLNTEMRIRFFETNLLNQDLSFSAVPLFDMGSVYNLNHPASAFAWNKMRYSEGIGMRIAWNLSTILRFDYAVSREDRQFFFTFEQAF
ncbi:MAG: hypothetical protein RL632_1326 [Bacteroidota bacterium]|jgi:outer membrane protein assembly factor BamA